MIDYKNDQDKNYHHRVILLDSVVFNKWELRAYLRI